MTEPPATAEPTLPAKPPGRVKVFNCPSCGGTITLRAVGHSVTAQCSHCSSLIDVANESYKVILAESREARTSPLPLGSRGKLLDTEWEVVGFQIRNDGEGTQWTEYLLFNPYQGYRFLMDEDGHWTIAKMLRRDVPEMGMTTHFMFDGREYKKFTEGKAYTDYVGGEFYWRASTDDVSSTMDYISPPYRLFMERTADEIVISHGAYLDAELVAEAFKIRYVQPFVTTVGASEPNRFFESAHPISFTALVAIVAMTAYQIATTAAADNAVAARASFAFTAADKDKGVTVQEFTLPKDGNLEIQTNGFLNNNWLELDVSVVNAKTGQSFDVVQGMEYYSGTDSDGAWSEGDPNSTVTLPDLPAGSYKLVVSPDSGTFVNAPATPAPLGDNFLRDFLKDKNTALPAPVVPTYLPEVKGEMLVRRDVPIWSNYFLAILALLIYPAYLLGRGVHFESRRNGSSWLSEDKDEE